MPSERLAKLEAESKHTSDMVSEIHDHVVGKPGTPGLTERLGKVEQRQALHSKISWAGFLTAIGILTAFFKARL